MTDESLTEHARAHVGALGLAVHEHVQADALLLVVGVAHVVVDHLLILLRAQLPLLELQARPPQLCTCGSTGFSAPERAVSRNEESHRTAKQPGWLHPTT